MPRLGITGMPPAMDSSVSREPGSVAKTVAGTSVSKRYCNKKGGSKGPPSTSILSDLLTVFRMPKGKPTLTGPMKTQKSFRRACMTRRSTSASRECSGTLATNRRPTGPRRALTNFRTQCVLAVALFGTHSDPGREGEKRPPTRSARLCGEDRRRRNGRGRATLLAKLAYYIV